MKLSNSLLPKLIQLKPIEMDLFIYLCRFADDDGVLRGIDYKDFMAKNGSKSTSFYDAKKALVEKELIYIIDTKCDYQTVVIKDNNAEAWKNGYINLNRAVFHSKKFKKLLPKEKWLVFEYYKNTAASHNGKHRITAANFYKKYTELMGVTEKTLRTYLRAIISFFDIFKYKGALYFTYVKQKLDTIYMPGHAKIPHTEDDYVFGHIVQTLIRKHKIKHATEQEIYDVAYLFKQYKDYREHLGTNCFTAWLDSSIKDSVFKQKIRMLNPKYVHKLLKQKLESFCIA